MQTPNLNCILYTVLCISRCILYTKSLHFRLRPDAYSFSAAISALSFHWRRALELFAQADPNVVCYSAMLAACALALKMAGLLAPDLAMEDVKVALSPEDAR